MKQLKQVHYFKSITDPKAPKDFIHKDERYCFSTFSVSGLVVLVWVPHMQGLLSEAGGKRITLLDSTNHASQASSKRTRLEGAEVFPKKRSTQGFPKKRIQVTKIIRNSY